MAASSPRGSVLPQSYPEGKARGLVLALPAQGFIFLGGSKGSGMTALEALGQRVWNGELSGGKLG